MQDKLSINSHTKAQAKYDKDHTTAIALKLNNKTDADVLEWLSLQESKQGAIKRLIRAEILREKLSLTVD